MRVITLQQPWASLVAWGDKDVENRRWPTSHRGLVAIHAGQQTDRTALGHQPAADALTERGMDVADLPRGVVLAVVELVDCHLAEDGCCPDWGFPGPYWHFVLADPRPLERPIGRRGQLGMPSMSEPDAAQVLSCLP